MPTSDDARVGTDGLWRDIAAGRPRASGGPALFLDRDGVIVDYVAFLHRPEEVRLKDGIARLIRSAHAANAAVVVATNQSGVGRGKYGWRAFAAVQDEIAERLGQDGEAVDAVFACPFHHEALAPYRHPDHPARKPNPGMLLTAGDALGLDLARSWMIGDRAIDVAAARAAGLAGALLLAGHNAGEETAQALSLARDGFAVVRIDHLDEAASYIDWLA